jgi:ubiquinone/menaquinone biosynthesis C-methylase UbiE
MGAPCVLASLGASDPEPRKHHLNGPRHDRTSAAAFAKVAESYERSRPGYPPELVSWVAGRLGIGPGTTVADVAAGTGKLTRELVQTGARVIAVEPLAEMREQLGAVLPGVDAREGTAEQLPLEDRSVDAITVAAAMHWFDIDRAMDEFIRVLKPGGAVAVLGPGRDLDQPLQRAVQEAIGEYLPEWSEIAGWREGIARNGRFRLAETNEVPFEQMLDAKGLAERIGTISYIARLPDEERAVVLASVRALGERQPQTPFPFRYRMGATIMRQT